MGFLVFVLFVVAIAGGCAAWCWREEIEHRLYGQHLRVRAVGQELAGLRSALRVELAGQVARQRLIAERRQANRDQRR